MPINITIDHASTDGGSSETSCDYSDSGSSQYAGRRAHRSPEPSDASTSDYSSDSDEEDPLDQIPLPTRLILDAHFPLRNELQITVASFTDRTIMRPVTQRLAADEDLDVTPDESDIGSDTDVDSKRHRLKRKLGNNRWARRSQKTFLQMPKIRRPEIATFTWVNGNTCDLVWMVRMASCTRSHLSDAYTEYYGQSTETPPWAERPGAPLVTPESSESSWYEGQRDERSVGSIRTYRPTHQLQLVPYRAEAWKYSLRYPMEQAEMPAELEQPSTKPATGFVWPRTGTASHSQAWESARGEPPSAPSPPVSEAASEGFGHRAWTAHPRQSCACPTCLRSLEPTRPRTAGAETDRSSGMPFELYISWRLMQLRREKAVKKKCAEKLQVEERWHRELLNRITETMQYSANGGYLQPECLLSGQENEHLWVVFPFLTVDKTLSHSTLNEARKILRTAPAANSHLRRLYDDSLLNPRRKVSEPIQPDLLRRTLLMTRQTLHRFYFQDSGDEESMHNRQDRYLHERGQLMVDQWWVLMPDDNTITTSTTSPVSILDSIHIRFKIPHPLILTLQILCAQTSTSTLSPIFSHYDLLINTINLSHHAHFRTLSTSTSTTTFDATPITQLNQLFDELRMLAHLFAAQESIMHKFAAAISLTDWSTGTPSIGSSNPHRRPYFPTSDPDRGRIAEKECRRLVDELLQNLAGHQARTVRIRESAASARDIEFQLLNIRQANATLNETRLSFAQARSVVVFTVFTVIFLPLSFFTSFFGMNVKEIGGEENPHGLGLFWWVAGCGSVGLVGGALLVAFNRRTRKGVGEVGRAGLWAVKMGWALGVRGTGVLRLWRGCRRARWGWGRGWWERTGREVWADVYGYDPDLEMGRSAKTHIA